MRVMRHYLDVPADARGAAVALGNFDGVHRGHHAVVSAARHAANQLGAPLGVVTFDPPPRRFFNPSSPSGQITSLDQKIERLAAIGVQFVYALRFDHVMAATSPDQFVSEVLHRGIAARHVVTGYDYRFGRNRTGDIATLGRLCRGLDIGFTPVAPAGSDGAIFSSTAIRDALRRGAPEDAAHILGRPWEICAPLELVQSDGQKLFPTAVVRIDHYLRPARGAYAVVVHDDRGWQCDATAHVGGSSDSHQDLIRLELYAHCPRQRGDNIRIDFLNRAPSNEREHQEPYSIQPSRSAMASS
jgi:riboflavin kinase / FMN adenylyltransferase